MSHECVIVFFTARLISHCLIRSFPSSWATVAAASPSPPPPPPLTPQARSGEQVRQGGP